MRLVIDTNMYSVQSWFAEKENIPGKTATIEGETCKAMLLRFDNDVLKWFPKSVLTQIDKSKIGDLTKWIDEDKDGIY